MFFSPQHPVDCLALIGPENRNKSLMLNIIGHLLAFVLVQMPHIIVELLDILPLQVGITFFLLILYDLYRKVEQQNHYSLDWISG